MLFDLLAVGWFIYVGDFGKSLIITVPLLVISPLLLLIGFINEKQNLFKL